MCVCHYFLYVRFYNYYRLTYLWWTYVCVCLCICISITYLCLSVVCVCVCVCVWCKAEPVPFENHKLCMLLCNKCLAGDVNGICAIFPLLQKKEERLKYINRCGTIPQVWRTNWERVWGMEGGKRLAIEIYIYKNNII